MYKAHRAVIFAIAQIFLLHDQSQDVLLMHPSILQYSSRFWNARAMNEGEYSDFARNIGYHAFD